MSVDEESWDATFDTNLRGSALLAVRLRARRWPRRAAAASY